MCLMGCLSFSVCFNTLASKSFMLEAKRSRFDEAKEGREKKNNFFFSRPKITILKRIIFQNERSVMF